MEDDLTFFENCFGIPLTRPINVIKQVYLNSYYFTTIPGGRPAGRAAGEFENKANSVQFQFQLPVGTEIGNNRLQLSYVAVDE